MMKRQQQRKSLPKSAGNSPQAPSNVFSPTSLARPSKLSHPSSTNASRGSNRTSTSRSTINLTQKCKASCNNSNQPGQEAAVAKLKQFSSSSSESNQVKSPSNPWFPHPCRTCCWLIPPDHGIGACPYKNTTCPKCGGQKHG